MKYILIILILFDTTILYSAENPFAGIFNNQLKKSVDSVNDSFKNFPDRSLSINEFIYLLSHKNQKTIRTLYVESGKKIPYIDFMQDYDREHVKIKGIDQILIIDKHRFTCHCGCVDKAQWNHWVAPPRYSIKTKFNLSVTGEKFYLKCNCGCNETQMSNKLDARNKLRN